MSQKNGRQGKAVVKGAPVKSKECLSPVKEVQCSRPEEQEEEQSNAESKDDTEEVDVGCEIPVNNGSKSLTKPNTDEVNRESNEGKSLPRPSAFSLVTPSRDGAEAFKSSGQNSDDSQAPAPVLNHPAFPWSTISSSTPLKPFPSPMAPEYSPYLLHDRSMYPPYYLPGNPHSSDLNSSFRPEFLDHQRPVIPQPISPAHTSLFPPYAYRYCHPLHPGPSLHYALYRPHELPMPLTGPRYIPMDLYGQTLGPKGYDLYMHSHPSLNASTQEQSNHGQSGDKATRQSPKEGCSALGSPDRPSHADCIYKDTESAHFTNMDESQRTTQQHTTTVVQPIKTDSRLEESAESLLQLRTLPVKKG